MDETSRATARRFAVTGPAELPAPRPVAPAPVTIDTPLRFESAKLRRFSGLSARRFAARAPGAAQCVAELRPDAVGRACTEALVRWLGLWPANGWTTP